MSASASEFHVWLPFPPSTNNLFTQGKVRGVIRRFPTPQYQKWQKIAARMIWAAKPRTIDGLAQITIHLRARDNRHRDVSNYIKAIEDALVAGKVLRGDDQRYVGTVIACWLPPNKKEPGATITVMKTGATADDL